MLKLVYLSAYNLFCLVGWSFLLYRVVLLVAEGKHTNLWKEIGSEIKIIQTAAFLEILHALVGLVRSPIARTLPQVGSRLAIVWLAMDPLYTLSSPKNAAKPFAEDYHYQVGILALISWCFAEIIRSSFYGLNSIDPKFVPYPLLFVRYTAFIILWPIGVTGEILTAWSTMPLCQAGKCGSLGGLVKTCPDNMPMLLYIGLSLYLPGLPFLYLSMLSERKKRLNPAPTPKLQGVVFPVTKNGDRSTTTAAKEVFAAAAAAVDDKAADQVRREKNWRFGYSRHINKNLELCARSEAAALKVAKAGLDKLYETMDYIRADGSSVKLIDAVKAAGEGTGGFETHTIRGSKARPAKLEIRVPYKCYHTGKTTELTGQALIDQVDKWVEHGTIEPDCGEAIKAVVKNPSWTDLSGQYFVLLGTTSAMGPFLLLKELGANIIAVDLDRPFIWKKIIETVQDSHASVTFPMKEKFAGQTGDALYKLCGCNLMNQVPEVCSWVRATVPAVCQGKPVTIGGYTYLDGELHVRVNMACDAVIRSLIDSYGPAKVRLAGLCTPTDAYLIPQEANAAAKANLKAAPLWQKLLQILAEPIGRLVPNAVPPLKTETGEELHRMDGLVIAQGPNYAMAKRLQQWRAILARSQGCVVSVNIAPATATASVVHNKQFAAAYGGMHVFKPMEIFYQEVSNAVMGALLLYDISSPDSAANPAVKLANPMQLFSCGAFHGGAMRCLYKFTSIGETAALIYYGRQYAVVLAAAAVAAAAAAAAAAQYTR